jgi:hypothetical protein
MSSVNTLNLCARGCGREVYRKTGLCWLHQQMPGKRLPHRPLCRHCHERPVSRPLGLCRTCYYTPGVRELYPSTSKFAPKGDRSGAPSVSSRGDSRGPNDPPWRCFYCLRWRCQVPISLCGECQRWLDERAATMPEDEREDVA